MNKLTPKEMTIAALSTAIMCIVGPLTIPIGPVPVTLINFIICLTVIVIGARSATISVAIYLLIGLIGLPVFSGFSGGLAKLAGPTGGYLIGYLFIPVIGGIFMKIFKEKYIFTGLGLILATAVLYFFGTLWFIIMMKCDVAYALTICVLPFIPFDLIKIVLAIIVGSAIKKALKFQR
jgi:biotin transport system substrate-specific component